MGSSSIFVLGANRPWRPPSAASPGGLRDDNYFRHFLDSPKQGLVALLLWSDLEPKGGGTFLACESVGVLARYLAAHPEGVRPAGLEIKKLFAECREFVELTGRVGDVVLLHLYLLHAASAIDSGKSRCLTNLPLALKQPLKFQRRVGDPFSPVEQAVLRGLGVEEMEFTPTAPRDAGAGAKISIECYKRSERGRDWACGKVCLTGTTA
jgi:hypothetical protein